MGSDVRGAPAVVCEGICPLLALSSGCSRISLPEAYMGFARAAEGGAAFGIWRPFELSTAQRILPSENYFDEESRAADVYFVATCGCM